MTAAPEAPAIDTSMESELGAALSSAAESAMSDAPAEAPVGDAAAPPQVEAAAPLDPAAPAPTPAAAPAAEPYKLTEDGAAYMVPKAELPTLTAHKQYAESVQNRFPTVNDAELGYLESSDFRTMRSDYLNGEQGDIDAVLGYWAGQDHTDPNLKAQFQQSFAKMAERLPQTLQKVNPQAYTKLSVGIIQAHVAALYGRAVQTGNADDLLAAQRFEWGMANADQGRLLDPERYNTGKPSPAKSTPDPLTGREQELQTREAQLLDRDWASFNKTSLDGPKWTGFYAEIDKALAPVKTQYQPVVFEALRDKIGKELIGKLQQDRAWASRHESERRAVQSAFSHLWKQRGSPDQLKATHIQPYTNDFMAQVRRLLPSIAQPLLNTAAAQPPSPATPPKPAQAATVPPRAPNGQFAPQKQERQAGYDLQSDPEFTSMFRVT